MNGIYDLICNEGGQQGDNNNINFVYLKWGAAVTSNRPNEGNKNNNKKVWVLKMGHRRNKHYVCLKRAGGQGRMLKKSGRGTTTEKTFVYLKWGAAVTSTTYA